jgi:hypothetical protein
MKPPSKPLILLMCLTVLAFVSLFFFPQTAWIVRDDVLSIVYPNALLNNLNGVDKTRALAAKRPNDFQLNLHAAQLDMNFGDVSESSSFSGASDTSVAAEKKIVAEFADLEKHYPNNPSVFANALRLECRTQYNVDSDADLQVVTQGGKPVPPCTPVQKMVVDSVIRTAISGQKIDPNNAFFPAMEATGYFANREDVSGLKCMIRAGKATTFNDYAADDIIGASRPLEIIDRGQSGEDFGALFYAESLSDNPELRAAARVAEWHAVLDEESGNYTQAFAIRHATARVGELMRTAHSIFFIGNIVGEAIISVSMARPDGGPAIETDPHLSKIHRQTSYSNQLLCNYRALLLKHHQAAEADWFAKVENSSVKMLVSSETAPTLIGFTESQVKRLVVNGGFQLLSWCLFLCILVLKTGLQFAIFVDASRRKFRGEINRRTVFAQPIAFIAFLVLLGLCVCSQVSVALNDVSSTAWTPAVPNLPNMNFYVISLLPGLAVLGTVCVVAWVRGKSATSVYLKIALPLLCIFALLYCGSVAYVGNQNAQIERYYGSILRMGEGPYVFSLLHKPWPGPAPEPVPFSEL